MRGMNAARAETTNCARPVALAVIAHALLWSVAPALIVGNLHQDTLEAAYWGNDGALGARHPPLLSLALELVLRLDHAPIFLLLLLSQIGMAVAASYVWRAASLFCGPRTAAVAVMMFLVSLSATFFAVQVNHNSALTPFWAATLFYALAYLERGGWGFAVKAGFSVGLGLLVKLELAFLVVCLVGLALAAPRYRRALFRPEAGGAAVIAAALTAPWVVSMLHGGGRALSYALGDRKVLDVAGLAFSALNLLDGQFILFVFPVAALLLVNRNFTSRRSRGERALVGAALAFGPSLVLLIGVILTDQTAKPQWVMPFASSCAVGLALLFPCDAGAKPADIAGRINLLSGGLVAAFLAYLFVGDVVGTAIGRPLTFYVPDSRRLGEAVEHFWRERGSGTLGCVVIAESKLAASTVLWLRSRPRFVDFSHPEWSRPADVRRCAESGGIAIFTRAGARAGVLVAFPALRGAPTRELVVPAAFGFSHAAWPAELAYLAPGRR
jgi:hypothetical protein